MIRTKGIKEKKIEYKLLYIDHPYLDQLIFLDKYTRNIIDTIHICNHISREISSTCSQDVVSKRSSRHAKAIGREIILAC